MHPIVIDTNIFISALIRNGLTRELIINSPFNLFFPECPIWSDDKHFQKQKEIKIFTTKEIIKIYKNI